MTALCRIEGEGRWLPRRLPALQTRRLLLRAPRPRDAGAITAGLADPDVARMLARVPRPYFRQDALDWLGGRPNGIGEEGFAFAVTHEGVLIGIVGFDHRPRGVEIGYWLDRAHWRRGLMSEAVSAALRWYFDTSGAGMVHSGVLSDNPASLKLQERLGFAVTGLGEVFVVARNLPQSLVETRLEAACFTPVPGSVPAAYRHVV